MRPNGLNDQNKNTNSQRRSNLSTKITQILVYKDLDLVGQYHFSGAKITIGKGKQVDLSLDDPRLETIQAILHIQNDNLIISDQGDRLCIYLNGKPIKAAVLEPLDLVEIGKYCLKIQLIQKSKGNSTVTKVNGRSKRPLNYGENDPFSSSKINSITKSLRSNVNKPPNKVGKAKATTYPDEFFDLPPYEDSDEIVSRKRKSRSRVNTATKSQIYSEDFFELPPYKDQPKSLMRDRSLQPRSKGQPKKKAYSEDFFELPAYKTKDRKISKRSDLRKKRSESAASGTNFVEKELILPDNYQTKKGIRHNSRRTVKGFLNSIRKDAFLKVDNEAKHGLSDKKTISRKAAGSLSNHNNFQRYSLVFSGNLKPGVTLLNVKYNLNYRFGIESRQLTRLIRGRKTILKKNLSHELAIKLYQAFDASGAICSIVPEDEPPQKNRGSESGVISDTNSIEKDFLFQKSEKTIEFDQDFSPLLSEVDAALNQSINATKHKKKSSPTDFSESEDLISSPKEFFAKKPDSMVGLPKSGPSEESEPWETSESFKDTTGLFLDELVVDNADDDSHSKRFNSLEAELSQGLEIEEEDSETPLQPFKINGPMIEEAPAEPFSVVPVNEIRRLSQSDFWEEDDDEEDFPADFRLKDKLNGDQTYYVGGDNKNNVLEVIKFLNHSVVDVTFLGKGEKYFILNSKGRKFKLAENKSGKKCFYYTNIDLDTQILTSNSAYSPEEFSSSGHNFSSRNNRHILENPQLVKIEDGAFEYHLRQVKPSPSPQVKVSATEKSKAWRHVLHSAVFHIFLLLFLGLIPWFSAPEPTEPEAQFVQIDPNLLATLEKPKEPPKKIELKPREIEPVKPLEEPPPKKKPEPPKPVQTIAKKKTVAKPTQVAKASTDAKKVSAAAPSRHPNAGGGTGKGNVVNRDIKQVGLLSMIGDSVGIQPQEATAAVTNLDAVASPGAGESNFKVGGIAGKLGTGKISVPSGGYVATKGSTQVLRSAGAAGPGRVAALERGNSGDRQVKGLVSAKMTRKVNIQGGMSREAVKQVIDQHLDEISYCYESALVNNPSIMGRMTYEWKIKASGSVGEVNIKSATINSNEIHACIKAAIKTWKFPQPQGAEVVVSYPFIFDIVGF